MNTLPHFLITRELLSSKGNQGLHSSSLTSSCSKVCDFWFLIGRFRSIFLCFCVSRLAASSPRLGLLAKCRVHLAQLTTRLLCSLEGQLLVIVITCKIDGSEKRNLSWLLNFSVRVLLNSAVTFINIFFSFFLGFDLNSLKATAAFKYCVLVFTSQ